MVEEVSVVVGTVTVEIVDVTVVGALVVYVVRIVSVVVGYVTVETVEVTVVGTLVVYVIS